MSIQLFFFLFLFSDYFCSIDACVVCTVSGSCNQSSALFFMQSSNRCIDAWTVSSKLVSHLHSSFLHIYSLRHLWDAKPYASSRVFLLSGAFPLVHFKNGVDQGDSPGIYPFDEISIMSFSFELFPRSPKIFFLIFFTLHLFDCVRFQYYHVFVCFLFSESSDFTWVGSSISSVLYHFLLFIIRMAHFSLPKSILTSWLYITAVCNRVPKSFSFFAKSLMSSMSLIFSCDLASSYFPVNFLSIWLSGIIAIANSKNDFASPWKIPLLVVVAVVVIFVIFHSFLIIHSKVIWRPFTGFWLTASFIWSPGLYSVF